MRLGMMRWVGGVSLLAMGIAAAGFLRGQVGFKLLPHEKDNLGATVLPNGHRIDPAGRQIELKGDLPVRMVFSKDGKSLYVVTGGFHQHGITVVDVESESVRRYQPSIKTTAGLEVSDRELLVTRGGDSIARLQLEAGATLKPYTEKLPANSWLAGLSTTADGRLVAIDQNRDVLVVFADGKIVAEVKVGHRPSAITRSEDGKTLAVSNEGSKSVTFIDATTLTVRDTVTVGVHPNELVYGANGVLFVANAGSNTVSILDGEKVVATVFTSHRAKDLVGSTPDALAISPDQKTLYVANADANEVAVINVAKPHSPRVKGFIPTGWYPSALAVSLDGGKLYVGVGKGLSFQANPKVVGADGQKRSPYIGDLLRGWVSVVSVPGDDELRRYTARVDAIAANRTLKIPSSNRITGDAFRKIKHVVYVIRENRTYDQVFGDMPNTNADPNNLMFGDNVTPNAHAIARQWVTLDNLYCDGEVSQDGHQWCDAAYATRFNEHAWPGSYASKGQPDDDDTVNSSPAGYLWDACRKKGRTYISYGEASGFTSTPDTAPVFEGEKGLEGHASLAWSNFDGRDYKKIDVFINDLKAAEKSGKWPNFMVMSLGEDHTSGLRAGAYTPEASVASNDLALGKMVEAISHSKFWAETAIFVIEDDAQNGADHVDAHRTIGLVISPYTARHMVDSSFYTTGSMIKTIELMLGLDPMTQHDRGSNPMYVSFTGIPNFEPYRAIPAKIDLEAKNPERTALARLSEKLDLTGYDRGDPKLMNEILWRHTHPGKPIPPVVLGIAR
jgi:YVTN family beta-propeller protein